MKPYDRVFQDGEQVMGVEEEEIFEMIEMLDP